MQWYIQQLKWFQAVSQLKNYFMSNKICMKANFDYFADD